jgi:hypothetical protein
LHAGDTRDLATDVMCCCSRCGARFFSCRTFEAERQNTMTESTSLKDGPEMKMPREAAFCFSE